MNLSVISLIATILSIIIGGSWVVFVYFSNQQDRANEESKKLSESICQNRLDYQEKIQLLNQTIDNKNDFIEDLAEDAKELREEIEDLKEKNKD